GRSADLDAALLRVPERGDRPGGEQRVEKPLPLRARGVGDVDIETVIAVLLGQEALQNEVLGHGQTRPTELRKESLDVAGTLLARLPGQGAAAVEEEVRPGRPVSGRRRLDLPQIWDPGRRVLL